MERVDPWYIPGSLQNLPPEDGRVAGFRFACRLRAGKTFLYVAHKVSVSVDGADASANLRIGYRGVTVPAAEAPATNWVVYAGEPVVFLVEYPGGLAPGRHRIRVQAVFGGGYGGRGDAGARRDLCDFEASLVQEPGSREAAKP